MKWPAPVNANTSATPIRPRSDSETLAGTSSQYGRSSNESIMAMFCTAIAAASVLCESFWKSVHYKIQVDVVFKKRFESRKNPCKAAS